MQRARGWWTVPAAISRSTSTSRVVSPPGGSSDGCGRGHGLRETHQEPALDLGRQPGLAQEHTVDGTDDLSPSASYVR